MKLILTRHGETIENQQNILQGHLPGTLSDNGKKQAKALAEKLKNTKIDCIYSSDLKRAVDTAKKVAEFHKNIPLILSEKIREVDLGPYTGKKKSEINWENRPEGMETRESMRERSMSLLKEAYQEYKKGIVLFVGHAGINMSIMAVIKGIPVENERKSIPHQGNTEINEFEISKDIFK